MIAVVDNLNAVDLLSVMRDGGAVDVVQRPAIDKQLVETVGRYTRPGNAVLVLDDSLIPRESDTFRRTEETVKTIAATNANVIVFGESGTGKEQIARQVYLNSYYRIIKAFANVVSVIIGLIVSVGMWVIIRPILRGVEWVITAFANNVCEYTEQIAGIIKANRMLIAERKRA